MRRDFKIFRSLFKASFCLLGVLFAIQFAEMPLKVFAVEAEPPSQAGVPAPSKAPVTKDLPAPQPQEVETPDPPVNNALPKTPSEINPSPAKGVERNEQPTATQNNTPSLQLVALVTEDGQPIEKGLLWRVFSDDGTEAPPPPPL